ncbi:HEPN domain-containing protein [Polyangium jinanense]|uniref:HEPN domain-containing protein n=1 Tax=Polyangium jinanense TaxID=2829994 RepID=A0A9X4ATN3_9BACT|nr:HEPN domain-containing protein [Polyangium jinanense]MDC3960096.1 HEPN domain-containing protein [Polyangium jinanense]MDC3984413.1 HEPN domain-containing protein [Polyangium jinanense]
MKTSLDHLPARKQEELRAITEILRAGAPLDMLILFGSHARGDWVEDPEHGYFSDYDLLAIVESPKLAEDTALWSELGTKAREVSGEAPITLIAHDIKYVNREIRAGNYFFGDIRNEGVLLYDSRRHALTKPKEATPKERAERAERNFSYWFESATGFLKGFEFFCGNGLNAHAAFLLHQAAERLYVAVSLVYTGYKRKSHNLEELDDEVAPLHPDLRGALPRTTPEDKHLFELLRRAYIDARYDKSYRVTAEELATLGERVRALAAVVERVCQEKLAGLRASAGGS